MARLRFDAVRGETSTALSPASVSFSSPGLARIGTVGGGDTALVCFYVTDANGNITASENVSITAHNIGDTSATILRGQEGTTPQSWPVNTAWSHGWSVADVSDVEFLTSAETTRALAAEAALSASIGSETNARIAADSTLQTNINNEAATRAAADTTLTNTKAYNLTRTSVKTGNYTASANQLVPCDATSASFTVTLQSGMADGSQVSVKLLATASGHTVTVATSGTDVFNQVGGSTTLSLYVTGADYNVVYDAATGVWTVISEVNQGVQGPQGAQGSQGAQGPQGTQGSQGPQGPQGTQGTQGAASTVPGPQGTQGPQGLTGPQGAQGPQGTQGLQGATGSQGPQGNQGNQGVQGIQGSQGNQGMAGPQGPTGATGATGPQGPQGAQGNQGPQGTQGNQGAQGATGAQGSTGAQGATGAQGSTGAQGATGSQGAQGQTGFQFSTINSQSSSYTAVAADATRLVQMTSSSATTFTIPTSTFSVGTQLNVMQTGTGQVTLASSGTIFSTGATSGSPKIRTQSAMATAICTAVTPVEIWYVVGDIV